MPATKTNTRFFEVALEDDVVGNFPVVVDSRSAHTFDDPGSGYKATHYRAYARPVYTAWCLAMTPAGNPFLADHEWLSATHAIHCTYPVKPGAVVLIGDHSSSGRITAARQPSLFGMICKAFGMPNPTKES